MKKVNYVDTGSSKSEPISMAKAILSGTTSTGGLYLPETITVFNKNELNKLKKADFNETMYIVLNKFGLTEDIEKKELKKLIKKAYKNFSTKIN